MTARLKLAMVGGGPGSFIGPVHRMSAELDGRMALVAGAFSSDAGRSRVAGSTYGIAAERAYASFEAMFAAEAARPDGARVAIIAAPNHIHFPAMRAAVQAGFAIICDKPVTATTAEAFALRDLLHAAQTPFCLTYSYTGYPMLREARALCAAGALGPIRKAVLAYPQGWLAAPIEREGMKQAAWRTDPAQAGIGGCSGDIGVHAFNLLEFVTGCKVTALCAQLSMVVPGRQLDDDCNMLLTLGDTVPAVIHASQVATGARNGLNLHLWGEQGGLAWTHEAPDELTIDWAHGTTEIRHAGGTFLSPQAQAASRLPSGHPQGFIEALANIYRDFAAVLSPGGPQSGEHLQGIDEGVRSMLFLEAAIQSSHARKWVAFDDVAQRGLA